MTFRSIVVRSRGGLTIESLLSSCWAHGDGDVGATHVTLETISEVEKRLAHWRRAYPRWPEGDVWEVTQLAALAARRFYIDANPLNRTKAATALVASYLANGREQSIEELVPTGTSCA